MEALEKDISCLNSLANRESGQKNPWDELTWSMKVKLANSESSRSFEPPRQYPCSTLSLAHACHWNNIDKNVHLAASPRTVKKL